MSQFGMQMPGGRRAKGASPDVYTALMVIASLGLLAACVVLWIQGTAVGKNGSPIGLQESGSVELGDR